MARQEVSYVYAANPAQQTVTSCRIEEADGNSVQYRVAAAGINQLTDLFNRAGLLIISFLAIFQVLPLRKRLRTPPRQIEIQEGTTPVF